MKPPSAWDKQSPYDSTAVGYWKMQVRHWQTLFPLGVIGGALIGSVITAFIITRM